MEQWQQFDGIHLLEGMDWDMGGAFVKTLFEGKVKNEYIAPNDLIKKESDGYYKVMKTDPFRNSLSTSTDIERMKLLHNAFVYFLNRTNYDAVAHMMDAFNDLDDVGDMKTVLTVTSAFKEHPILGKPRARLLEAFNKAMKY